jgi:hypothetical protein
MLRVSHPALAALAVGMALFPAAASAAPPLPAETAIPVALETTISSATSHPEDRVIAKVRADVLSGKTVVIPAGSELRGHVVTVRRPGKVKGKGYLSFSFNELVVKGKTYPIATHANGMEAPDAHKKDAATIGGGAAAGAVVGALVDGGSGAAKGAAVGAGAGTGVVLATRGPDVTLSAGSHWRVRLLKPLALD